MTYMCVCWYVGVCEGVLKRVSSDSACMCVYACDQCACELVCKWMHLGA